MKPTPARSVVRRPPSGPPRRRPDVHKGDAGCVGIVAGSAGMSGAAVLAGLGALRAGAGLVRVHTPKSLQPIVAASEPSYMTVGLPEDADGQLAAGAAHGIDFAWCDVLAAGPGLGRSAGLVRVMEALVRRTSGALILDADGLNNLAPRIGKVLAARQDRPTIVTPHPGEMARLWMGLGRAPEELWGQDATRRRVAAEFARATGAVVVLKGFRTVVSDGRRTYVNPTGNPGMATGGMGDVLTGLLAALVGQRMTAWEAACLAVYAHGAAADALAKRIGPVGYLPREVADALPAALAEWRRRGARAARRTPRLPAT
ncbi:MAG: NAD(P)H-hydrate dehydratase [Phycisphaerae bacterium]